MKKPPTPPTVLLSGSRHLPCPIPNDSHSGRKRRPSSHRGQTRPRGLGWLTQGQGSTRSSAVTVVLPSTRSPPSPLAFCATMASENQAPGPTRPQWSCVAHLDARVACQPGQQARHLSHPRTGDRGASGESLRASSTRRPRAPERYTARKRRRYKHASYRESSLSDRRGPGAVRRLVNA